jgi:7-cyano-7-deazaguanine synthase
MKKKALVVHSGGMDSSLCLAQAVQEFGKEWVISVSFSYGQRHEVELSRAQAVCEIWDVDHVVLDLRCLNEITENALTRHEMLISAALPHHPPNTLVVGRNGLMARLGAIHAHHLGAHAVYMGVIEVESANSGYRDCSRSYMDKMQEILRIDLDDPRFEVRTPLVFMTKKQTMALGYKLGVLEFLLETTISCYEGADKLGCQKCPACQLRNEGIRQFLIEVPDLQFSYKIPLLEATKKFL